MSRLKTFLVAIALSLLIVSTTSARQWTVAKGKTLEAVLVDVTETTVQLRGADGKPYVVAIKNLSKADQKYIPRALPAEIVAAWKKAGAEIGWAGRLSPYGVWVSELTIIFHRPPSRCPPLAVLDVSEGSFLSFTPKLEALDAASAVPAIRITGKGNGWRKELATLPLPAQAFGLDCDIGGDANWIGDAALTKLAALKQLTMLNLRGYEVSDAGMKELAGLKRLTTLELSAQITDAGLKELAELKQLTSLRLLSYNTGAGLKELAELKQLTSLHLYKPTAVGLKELAGMKQLTSLHIIARHQNLKGLAGLKQLTSLSMEGVRNAEELKELAGLKQLTSLGVYDSGHVDNGFTDELAGLKQLTSLRLVGLQFTDAGMKELAGLKQLTSLRLLGPVTDAGLKELAGMKQLRALVLYYNPLITDAGLKELAGMKQLTSLIVFSVTDAGLKELAELKQLRALVLYYNPLITDAGLQELQTALPNCRMNPEKMKMNMNMDMNIWFSIR